MALKMRTPGSRDAPACTLPNLQRINELQQGSSRLSRNPRAGSQPQVVVLPDHGGTYLSASRNRRASVTRQRSSRASAASSLAREFRPSLAVAAGGMPRMISSKKPGSDPVRPGKQIVTAPKASSRPAAQFLAVTQTACARIEDGEGITSTGGSSVMVGSPDVRASFVERQPTEPT